MNWVLWLFLFCQLLQLTVVEDCRHVQPEVERAWLTFECNFEVTVDSLLEVMQLDDEEPLSNSWTIWVFNLVPRLGLSQLLFCEDVDMVFLPFLVLRHELDLVFVECGDQQIKLIQLLWERSKANTVEIECLLSHVFKHPVEREMIMLSQTQFEEILLLLPKFRLQFVEESDEELHVALLAADSKCLLIFGTLSIVMCNSFFI